MRSNGESDPVPRLLERLEEGHQAVDFWITPRGRYLELNRLAVPDELRGMGAGSSSMSDLVDAADEHGLVLAVTPSTAFGATSRSRLEEFYRGFGFVENSGPGRDFKTREAMYRAPGGGGW